MSQPRHLQISVRICAMFVLITFTSVTALAQAASQYDRGTPPQHAAGVASFGSYTSPDVGSVNLSNGSMNLSIPLGTVGGRGFSIPITLNYSSKVWSVSKETDYVDGVTTVAYAAYGAGEFLSGYHNRLTPGWSVGIAPWLTVRSFGIDPLVHPGCGFNRWLTKLTVTLPDRGEIELRDDYTDGAPHLATTKPNTGNCKWYDANRNQRWHAADGSGIIFITDALNGVVTGDLRGVLITADGTRYRFVNASDVPTGNLLARAESITDRNGNKITVGYPNLNEVTYTDQLNRVTRIKKNVQDPQTGQQLDLLVELPGFGGVRYYKVKSGVMNQNYRAGINPVMPVLTGLNNPMNHQFIDPWWGGGGSQLFPQSNVLFAGRVDTSTVVNELILPDNRSLRFRYNEYGEVAEVELPTGGKMQYDYAQATALPTGLSLPIEVQTFIVPSYLNDVDRAVIARRTYADGANLEGSWTYTYTSSTAEAKTFSATGTLLRNEKRYFMPAGRYLQDYNDGTNGTGYTLWSTGLESRSEVRNAANAVITASETDWTQRAAVSWWTGYSQQQPANDNRINVLRRYVDTGAMAKTEMFYDQYNNPIEVKEYDYDQTLKRRTVTTYIAALNGFNYQTNDTIHLLSLPENQTTYDGSGNQKAKTVTEYDQYVSDGDRGAMTSYLSVSQHDSTYGAAKSTRGNPTRIGVWLNTTGGFIYTYPRYDIVGNVVSLKDEGGAISIVSFADNFGDGTNPEVFTQNPSTPTYALPTLFTSPPPAPGAPVHTARSQYDFSTGLLTGFRDRNNVITQTIYNDPFNRPTQVKAALGVTGVETHTSTFYAPATVYGITLAKNDVLTATDLNSLDDGSIRSWTVTDGFGRTTEAWNNDPLGDVKVVTTYDCLSRVKQTSNPYRPSAESAAFTTTAYDLAGRVVSVATPDTAVVGTVYSGNTVTVTDQAGKVRMSVTDALGRLVKVHEAPNGVDYQTSYLYDALDNLVKVTQDSQQRFFMYDSLKRLIRARNPEQQTRPSLDLSDPVTGNSAWTMAYQYDASSNLTQKTDARGVTSTYAYDALDRNTSIDYSGSTPDVFRQYDLATNGKGRVNQVWQSGTITSATNIDSYDALGRPLIKRQRYETAGVWSSSYQTNRTYNLAGGVISQTYPSGRTVSYSRDTVGRATGVSGNLGDGTVRTYAANINYSPWGGITKEQYGTNTPLYRKSFYNIRGQLFDTRLSSVNDLWDWNRGRLILYYSSNHLWAGSGSDNNGNVRFAETWIPPENAALDQTDTLVEDAYTYDSLNRLTSVVEQRMSVATGWGTWHHQFRQEYTIDRYGNRTINAALTSGTGVNNKVFAVDTTTNRLGVPSGQPGSMIYDEAGNLLTDTYSGAGGRTYDAENRMTTAADNTNQTSRYTYDADGMRVRVQASSSQERWFIYGFDNELLAEYRASSSPSAPEKEYGYRNGQMLITATGRLNVALASNGAVATASSAHTCCGFSTTGAINGNYRGPWSTGEGWNDATQNTVPDWIQVDFAGSKTIDEISVFSLHDNYTQENTPTETQTFSLYGLLNFDVQYWNGSSWTTIPGGSVTGNNKVWRKFTFSPITTSKIRVWINAVPDDWSRVVEIQAFGIPAGGEKVQWLVPDHLGTPRMVVDLTGNLANIKRHDYLPFGEELFAPAGGRSAALGYSTTDGVRQQFTSKERDSETSLDYFHARYYSNTMGRFTGVDPYDPITLGASKGTRDSYLLQPQNWNRYTYSLNNPQKYVDPDGKNPLLTALGGAAIGAVFGGGFEVARALYRGESLTDPNVLRRVGAKALNGAVFGAVVGLTGNIAAGSAAATMATAAVGSVAGGLAERAVDGDDSTAVFSGSDIVVDAVAGAAAGLVYHKVSGLVGDMTYSLRQGAYEAFEGLSGGPFKTLEREALKRGLNTYNRTYNVSPQFLQPERIVGGAARGATRGGISAVGRFLLDIVNNQREEQKRQQRPPKDCKKGCVTVTVIPL